MTVQLRLQLLHAIAVMRRHFLVGRVSGQTVSTLFQITHDVVAQFFGADLGNGRDHVNRASPLKAINHLDRKSVV